MPQLCSQGIQSRVDLDPGSLVAVTLESIHGQRAFGPALLDIHYCPTDTSVCVCNRQHGQSAPRSFFPFFFISCKKCAMRAKSYAAVAWTRC